MGGAWGQMAPEGQGHGGTLVPENAAASPQGEPPGWGGDPAPPPGEGQGAGAVRCPLNPPRSGDGVSLPVFRGL